MTMDDSLWLSIKWRIHYDGWLCMIMNALMNGTDYNDPPLMDYLCLWLSIIMILIHDNGLATSMDYPHGLWWIWIIQWIMVDMDDYEWYWKHDVCFAGWFHQQKMMMFNEDSMGTYGSFEWKWLDWLSHQIWWYRVYRNGYYSGILLPQYSGPMMIPSWSLDS